MVQQRGPHFQRGRHTHAVYLGQNVSRQVSLGREVQQFSEWVGFWSCYQIMLEAIVRRCLLISPRHKILREKRALPNTGRQQGDAVQVAVARRQSKIE